MNVQNRINEIKEQITNLVESLEETGSYGLSFYEECRDDFAKREYLENMITEWADSQVNLSWLSLWSWVRECCCATDYIQQAVAEGFIDCKEFDMCKVIQCAQYLFYSDAIYEEFTTLEQLKLLHEELHNLELELDDQVA